MSVKNFACLLLLSVIFVANSKRYHPVPTFFGRKNLDGSFVDRSASNFDEEILNKPFLNHISRTDASATLKLSPNPVQNGGKVAVTWNGITNATEKDFIAYYCPAHDNPSHYLDRIEVTQSSSWQKGYGQVSVIVYNMRSTCVFKYFRFINASQLVATSTELSFSGGTIAPLQGHIAMTTKPSEMRVMWVSGEVNQPAVVKYGTSKKSLTMSEYEVVVRTYSADSMCTGPANTTGFWHPGYIFDILLKNLEPNTKYYYSFGTKDKMSEVRNFTSPMAAGDHTPYKMIIYGDMGVDPEPQAYATAELVEDEIRKNDVKFVFHHGDISYARGQAYIWEQWFHLVEPYASTIPYMVGVGNHEQDHTRGGAGKDPSGVTTDSSWEPSWFNGGDDSGGECGVPMFNRFHMPDNGNAIFWYSYDYGLAHYIMISTEHDFSPGSKQYKWLENDLKNVDRSVTPWVMIAGHRAMYCSQKEESDYVVSLNMQRLFEDLLYKYKVDLAFWAHYHSYERTCKVYKGKCSDDGITHIVVGSAGKSIDSEEWYGKEWSLFHRRNYGYGRVTIANSTAMLYEWIQNDKNLVQDHVWLIK